MINRLPAPKSHPRPRKASAPGRARTQRAAGPRAARDGGDRYKALVTRRLALSILCAVEREGRFSTESLRRASRRDDIFFSFLQRLVKGTLQWQGRLDGELKHVGLDVESVTPPQRWLLRMAAYQLTMLEVSHPPIVISETERLAKKSYPRLRELRRIEAQAPRTLTPESLAEYYSHPLWVVERWVRRIGLKATKSLCEANNQPWPVCIRVNLSKVRPERLVEILNASGIKVQPGHYLDTTLVIESVPKALRLDRLPEFKQGLFQVQDESAQMISLLLDPQPGELVLDACAAPGGKTTHIAQLMRNRGRVVALDLSEGRLHMVQENCERQGASIVQLEAGDALQFESRKLFDRVLLDAPCSGFGVLGRKSDIRGLRKEQDLKDLVDLQGRLITHLATLVKPGGYLLYSTCTLLEEENQFIIAKFLKDNPSFELVPATVVPQECRTREGYLELWPDRHGVAGAFAALMRRLPAPS